MSRPRAYVFGLGVIAAVAYPVTFPTHYDSYPLSSYPMFSHKRERPTVYYAQAVDEEGEALRVAPELVGSYEVMQAAVTVRRSIQSGKASMRRLCRTVALRALEDPRYAGSRRIELVSAEFDPVAYFVKGPEPLRQKVHHRCRVKGRK